MSRIQKLKDRLASKPKDFTFDEAKTLLEASGYVMSHAGKTGGSRVTFKIGDHAFRLHKPHPGNILKPYLIKELIEELGDML